MDQRKRLIGFAAMIAVAVTAQAAVADPVAAPINWTGFYLGGDVGALFTDAGYTRPGSGLQPTSLGTIDGRPTYGVYGGFNYQVTPWVVVGLEANFNWLSTAYYRELGFQTDFLQQSRGIEALTARGGFLVRPDTLIYGKIGPAGLNVAGFNGFPGGPGGGPFQQTLLSVQGGVGIESLVTPNISVRGEVSYTAASQLSLNGGADLYRPAVLMLDVGASYKFDVPQNWGTPTAAQALPPVPFLPAWIPGVVPLPFQRPPGPANPEPYWNGVEFGGFASLNGNQMKYFDTLAGGSAGQLGPYTAFTAGGGWFVGINYQYERVVVGIDVGGNYETANFQTAAGSGGAVNFYRFANVDRILALTGRIGWLMTPSTLLYIKGGPADLRMTPNTNYWNAIAPNTVGGTTFAGYEAGIGVETYLLPNLSVRLEGLYVHSDRWIVLNGTVPSEYSLQPSVLSATLGIALHI